jgi:hypothetical protein
MRWIPFAVLFLLSSCGSVATEQVAPGDEELGKLDKASAKETIVEIKVSLAPEEIDAGLAAFGLKKSKAERRWVTFYDTAGLELYERGLLLRSRKVADDDDDSTVKVRPLDASKVSSSWFKLKGFKCEIDRTGAKAVSSCSLSAPSDPGEIDEVALGERTIKKLFTDEQESFAAKYGGGEPGWSELRALGPTDAWVWKLASASGLELTVELWELESLRLLEVSTKEKASQADAAEKVLLQDLQALGLTPWIAGETKTKTVLSHFASRAP